MGMPNLKRINIHSEMELDVWLKRNADCDKSVMVVTHTNESNPKFVSHEQVGKVLSTRGWKAGRRYTLSSDLLGHVISKSDS